MIVYGYAKNYRYNGDGTLEIQVRIPNIHGPYNQSEYRGTFVRNYTLDSELPYYPSLLLPHMPTEGEIVALSSLDSTANQFIVLGLTGGSFLNGSLIAEGV